MAKFRSIVRSLFFALSLVAFPAMAIEPMPVNVNAADAQTIASALNGVGIVRAQAIVDWREKHGAFQSVDQLLEIRGIGEKLLAKNRKFILLE